MAYVIRIMHVYGFSVVKQRRFSLMNAALKPIAYRSRRVRQVCSDGYVVGVSLPCTLSWHSQFSRPKRKSRYETSWNENAAVTLSSRRSPLLFERYFSHRRSSAEMLTARLVSTFVVLAMYFIIPTRRTVLISERATTSYIISVSMSWNWN